MQRTLSYILAFCLTLLIIAPNIPYSIPLIVNSFSWCYLVVVCGLLGIKVFQFDIHPAIKLLSAYCFANCFLSQAPYLSFNAYILTVASIYFFFAFQHADFRIIVRMLEAAFWFEVILTVFQLAGRDRLLNFDRPEPVFFGTVMQYMRFSSLLAILAPFLIIKSRWYIIPVIILCVISRSSTFAMSLIAGFGAYFLLKLKTWKARGGVILCGILLVLAFAAYDFGSFRGAIVASNGGRLYSWMVIFITWFTDTSQASPPPFVGPFNLQWFLFGHGMDTFLPLFPIYKHDMNPFPQAHNCWLQFAWEIGIIGFLLIVIYAGSLVRRLYRLQEYELIAGLACIATNMFFSFPTRMTQTALLIVAYAGFCELIIILRKKRLTDGID